MKNISKLLAVIVVMITVSGTAGAQEQTELITGLGIAGFFIILVLIIIGFLLSGLTLIRDDQVGIRTRKMFGPKMPQGQIIARSGEIGVQADTLMPGLYWFNPLTWKVHKVPVIVIGSDKIGIAKSVDGEPILPGRLLGDAVECNSFQDARAFLNNGGKKGPQVAILKPGTYRINTEIFSVERLDVIKIGEEKIGVVISLDGIPLPSGYIIAPKPTDDNHRFFQDGQAFLQANGYRGPQLDTLQPGNYYINPLLFDVTEYDMAEVLPGYVAVLRSNIGLELAKGTEGPAPTDKEPDLKQPIHEKEEVILTTDRNQRGIWKEPVAPGKYNMNPLAFTAYKVPTSAITIDWAAGTDIRTSDDILIQTGAATVRKVPKEESSRRKEETRTYKATEFFKFSQLTVTSKDGFILEVDVRLVIRIRPPNAPFIIQRFGSVENLIEQIVHPLIDSSFRNNAGEKKAIDFIQGRTALQKDALDKARDEFDKYHVEAQNLLIAYIDVDENLLKTQTEKEIASQQQEQYKQQALAQQENIAVQEQTARAAKQKDVIDAKLGIDIAADKATAKIKESEGIREATKIEADGIAYKNREEGKGLADAYKAQADVIGADKLALIKVVTEVATGKVKIVPDFLIQGGEGGSGNLFNAWMANMVIEQEKKKKVEMKEE